MSATIESFTQYFNNFYGPNGIYPSTRTISISEIEAVLPKVKNWGGGDSFDREVVRDLIFSKDEMDEMYSK